MYKNLLLLIVVIVLFFVCGLVFVGIYTSAEVDLEREKKFAEQSVSLYQSTVSHALTDIDKTLSTSAAKIYTFDGNREKIKKYLTETLIIQALILHDESNVLLISTDESDKKKSCYDNISLNTLNKIPEQAPTTTYRRGQFGQLQCSDNSILLLYWDILSERKYNPYREIKILVAFRLNPALLEEKLKEAFDNYTKHYKEGAKQPIYFYNPYQHMYIALEHQQKGLLREWGDKKSKENARNKASAQLEAPFQNYYVSYYGPNIIGIAPFYKILILASIILVMLALLGLAFFIYRKQIRRQRLADQQVSFTNQVSHELKTPLTNIKLYAELLNENIKQGSDLNNEENAEFTNVITSETERLNRLINNVLNFAKNKKNKLELNATSGVIDELINKIISLFDPLFAIKNVKIYFDGNAHNTVKFDHDIIEQILNNLLSNVEKYGYQGGRLEIFSSQNKNLNTIHVRDFGPGIPKNAQKKIFNDFYRASSKLSDGVTGTGIGLSIAKQLAKLHGGDLILLSTDVGACFQLTFYAK